MWRCEMAVETPGRCQKRGLLREGKPHGLVVAVANPERETGLVETWFRDRARRTASCRPRRQRTRRTTLMCRYERPSSRLLMSSALKGIDPPSSCFSPVTLLSRRLSPCPGYKRIESVLPALDPLCIVALGSSNRFVAEQLGYFLQGDAFLKQVHGERVPQPVAPHVTIAFNLLPQKLER